MSTHNIGFYEEISKIIIKYHQIRNLFLLLSVEVLNFWTPKIFAVITLKFKLRGVSLEKCIQKMQMEWQTLLTLIKLV